MTPTEMHISALEDKIESLTTELIQYKEAARSEAQFVNELQEEIEELISENDKLQSRVRFLEERNSALRSKVDLTNQVNDGLHLLLKEEENKYETLQAHDEIICLSEELESIDDMVNLCRQSDILIQTLNDQIDHLTDINFELEQNMLAAQDQNHYYKQLCEFRDINFSLREENSKLRQALGSIENMSDSHSVMTKQEINLWVYDFLKELE